MQVRKGEGTIIRFSAIKPSMVIFLDFRKRSIFILYLLASLKFSLNVYLCRYTTGILLLSDVSAERFPSQSATAVLLASKNMKLLILHIFYPGACTSLLFPYWKPNGRASKHLISEWPDVEDLTVPRKKKVRPVSERRKNNQEKNFSSKGSTARERKRWGWGEAYRDRLACFQVLKLNRSTLL